MTRPKRNSSLLRRTRRQLEVVLSIDPKLDLGNGLTVKKLTELINRLDKNLNTYNGKLSEVDAAGDVVDEDEQALKEFLDYFLMGFACRFGSDSFETQKVEQAGKEPKKPPKPPINPPLAS